MSTTTTATTPSLIVTGLRAGYGRREVVYGIDLHVDPGEVVAIMGHNGAGKTTTLDSIFGLIDGATGSVRHAGTEILGAGCAPNVRRGMSLIPAENFVFGDLSVLDNLRIGAYTERDRSAIGDRLNEVCRLMPLLEERRDQLAGTLSGGQQRLLSVGIALMSNPNVILLDEPSLGLSPTFVEEVMDLVRRLADERQVSILMLEQNVAQSLRVADRIYVMRSGRIIMEETAEEMRERDNYWDLF